VTYWFSHCTNSIEAGQLRLTRAELSELGWRVTGTEGPGVTLGQNGQQVSPPPVLPES
jgi:hypothetical protein